MNHFIIINIYKDMSHRTNFQDWEPVVLTKTKSHTSKNVSATSKSNIHISKPKIEDDNEAHRIKKYSADQIKLISGKRNALGLSHIQLAQKVHVSLKGSFIANIENGSAAFDEKTYNTIKRKLGITEN